MQSGLKSNKRLKDFNQKSFEKHLNFAKKFLYHGNIEEAWDSFHDALTVNFESAEAKDGMKIAGFWKERQVKLETLDDHLEKGEFLLREFTSFAKDYVNNHNINWLHGVKSVEHWVFYTAYNSFMRYGELTSNEKDPGLLLKQGYCLKKMGDYEQAQLLLEEAVNLQKNNSSILAQLADVYSLINEDKHAKLFFREAFFISPDEVDLDSLESIIIHKIIDELKYKNYSLLELKQWIPVYGTVLGLFSVKKELKPIEVGLLKQSIYSLNNQLSVGDIDKGIIIPKLINHYFRLLEHFVSAKGSKSEIDEVLLNIKLLDSKIYNLYLN
ncbi:MAG: tetratricopeptide repeat protein [Spirochaetaceae bacterium]